MSARNVDRASQRDLLKTLFASVPLGLKRLGGAIDPRSPSIFQMDIHRSPTFGEYFRIWPGAHDNEIEVLSVDRGFQQLVLRVQEPRRPFVQVLRKTHSFSLTRVEAEARASGGHLLKETRNEWRFQMWTPGGNRRLLCGRDDGHLFVAQVRAGDTVAEAHAALKPWLVQEAEARGPGHVQRQGEWFFVATTPAEAFRLRAQLAARPRALQTWAAVGSGARPHRAERVVVLERPFRERPWEGRPETYATGHVVHADHMTVRLDGWRRVVRNAEVGARAREVLRVRWID
jgi:hypothetical protein